MSRHDWPAFLRDRIGSADPRLQTFLGAGMAELHAFGKLSWQKPERRQSTSHAASLRIPLACPFFEVPAHFADDDDRLRCGSFSNIRDS